MKALHRPDLFSWSRFDEVRDLDFHSVAWIRPAGNVIVNPLPMIAHDHDHLARLGGASLVVVTNRDHVRAAREIATVFGARLAAPAAEQGSFPLAADRWLGDGDEVVPGMRALALAGSKTPGELALVLEETTLIVGDLVRCHRAGTLTMLPAAKLADREAALASVRRLAELPSVEAVLVGDGFQVFAGGKRLLAELASKA